MRSFKKKFKWGFVFVLLKVRGSCCRGLLAVFGWLGFPVFLLGGCILAFLGCFLLELVFDWLVGAVFFDLFGVCSARHLLELVWVIFVASWACCCSLLISCVWYLSLVSVSFLLFSPGISVFCFIWVLFVVLCFLFSPGVVFWGFAGRFFGCWVGVLGFLWVGVGWVYSV